MAPANNAQILGERLKSRWPSYRPLTQPRHLLPVHQKQKLICTGYPELAQYIVGQPRSLADSYIAMLRPIVQELYAALVEEFGS